MAEIQRLRWTPDQFHQLGVMGRTERVIEVYRAPQGEEYRLLRRYTPEETIPPLLDAEWQVQVGSLFPQTP